MKKFFFALLFSASILPQQRINLLHYLIKSDSSTNFIIDQMDKYRPQILYTQVNRDDNGKIILSTQRFNANEAEYFYPASTVKLPVALLALEKINELKIPGLTKFTRMKTDSAFSGQSRVIFDSTSENFFPSVAHYIKKIFLVSDNDAFNRLYEFLGQDYINEKLVSKGYLNTKITHRLSVPLSVEQNKCVNPVTFISEKGDTLYSEKLRCTDRDYSNNLATANIGEGYMQGDSLIKKPKDFSGSNYFSVYDMHNMLISVIYPESVEPQKRFNLTEDDYKFLYEYMSKLPRESTYPRYDSSYYDGYLKFFIFGNAKNPIPERFRIFNKSGLAYGFLLDNAYIVDLTNNIEFFLTAVLYLNEDGILNDDNYDYYAVGFPFFQNLGLTIYNYELIRENKNRGDLRKFDVKAGSPD